MSEDINIFGTVVEIHRSPKNILDEEIVMIATRPRYKIANEKPGITLFILRGCQINDIELHKNYKNIHIRDIVHVELSPNNIPVHIEIISRF